MNIDLTLQFQNSGTGIASHTIRYARIDNTNNPVYTTITGITASPYSISGVPNGQYRVFIKPVYSDQRTCNETSYDTSPCAGMISVSAVVSGSNIQVSYTAPSSASNVILKINYPNGGQFNQMFTNGANGSVILVPIPSGVYGSYNVSMQSVCDASTGFYSISSSPITVQVNQSNTTIDGSQCKYFTTANDTQGGNIIGTAGATINCIISASGGMSGFGLAIQFPSNPSIPSETVTDGQLSFSFVMPAGGTVFFTGQFTHPNSSGSAAICVS